MGHFPIYYLLAEVVMCNAELQDWFSLYGLEPEAEGGCLWVFGIGLAFRCAPWEPVDIG